MHQGGNHLRTVFDTNVLISALLISNSTSAKALRVCEENGQVLYSIPILEEISAVLSRPKFAPYIEEDQITGFLARIYRSWCEVKILHSVKACRDPKDDKFLDVAINGDACTLITGDKDLLALNPFRGVRIMPPDQYLVKIDK